MRKTILVIFGILIIIFFGKLALTAINLSPILFQFIFNREISLKKANHHINLLLLGIAGGQHEGPNLSDTIIFASFDLEKNKINLISIPRDLWVPDLKAKINIAYAVGEAKKKGGGLILAKAAVSKITGQPIDYGFRGDFAGFVKAVDLINGLDVEVERTFDDFEYPIEGKETDPCGHSEEEVNDLATASSQLEAFPCRYTHLHFDKGRQKMDGETALSFVRSRHAQGEEGTDFARSKRQEKILLAFKNKVLSMPILLNPLKVMSFYSILEESIDTDIKKDEFDDFIKLFQKMRTAKVQSAVLDSGDKQKNRQGLLMTPSVSEEYDHQWVLIPRIGNGNFKEIQKYIECEIETGNCTIPKEL